MLLLSILLLSCSSERPCKANLDYTLLVANSFSVTKQDLSDNTSESVFTNSRDSEFLISCAAYDHKNDRIAIALKTKEPSTKSAKIILVESKTPYGLVKEIETGLDRILNMSFSKNGDLAFVAGKLLLDGPHNICIIRNDFEKIEGIASGRKFFGLSWNFNSKRVYFASLEGTKRMVGYLNINDPVLLHDLFEGRSISASDNEDKVCFLDLKASAFLIKNGGVLEKLKLSPKPLDPRFADAISFVRFGDELIAQSYVKATTDKLLIISPPYDEVYTLVKGVGNQSLEVIRKAK